MPQSACNPTGDTLEPPLRTVVLGIGNVLWADEGFGVRCVESLQQHWDFAPHVQLIDGGTQGLYLIHHVQSADRLLIFDAIDYGLQPGTLKIIEGDAVPKFMGAKKMSLHQTGFQEVLSLAQFTGHYPEQIVLIGCQPEELEDYGGSLRDSVKVAMGRALEIGLERLREWGACPVRREAPLAEAEAVTVRTISLERYESGRPDADAACRIGDERFLMTRPPAELLAQWATPGAATADATDPMPDGLRSVRAEPPRAPTVPSAATGREG